MVVAVMKAKLLSALFLIAGLSFSFCLSAQPDAGYSWKRPGDTNEQIRDEVSPERNSWSARDDGWNAVDASGLTYPDRPADGESYDPGIAGTPYGSGGQSRDRYHDQFRRRSETREEPDTSFDRPQGMPLSFDGGRSGSAGDDRYDFRPDGTPESSQTSPGYRFRGDPLSGPSNRQNPSDTGQYHFRPLSDIEKERMRQTPFWRPLD